MRQNHLVIGIYYHPEAYPPTLNAIRELSDNFEKISVVHRPHLKGTWKYPPNVTAIASGTYISSSGQEKASTSRKIGFFVRFAADLLKECLRKKPRVILLYDANALLAYRLIRPFLYFKHLLWYHNHDIAEISTVRKYSVGWFACKTEKSIFRKIDLFTLPSAERLAFFPMKEFRGKYFVIPNYPSLAFYGPFYHPGKPLDSIKLIFQGRIGPGHGLEEIIPLLTHTVKGRPVSLVLKGHCDQAYKETIISLAQACHVEDKVSFVGFTPYEEVPKVASVCHIGIGIFSAGEVMHVTLGTASNKLYEYAALGLPVLYLGREHFSKYLGKYPWAVAVELTTASITSKIEAILSDYEFYSRSAYESFQKELNFEYCFASVTRELSSGKEDHRK